LKLDQWETKEGEKRSAIRVVLDNFEFVDAGKSDGHTTSDQSNRPVTPTEKPKPQESLSDDNGFDEDVPF
jgi:single-strand DNA-binding protein